MYRFDGGSCSSVTFAACWTPKIDDQDSMLLGLGNKLILHTFPTKSSWKIILFHLQDKILE
jgi:hypothetical protein